MLNKNTCQPSQGPSQGPSCSAQQKALTGKSATISSQRDSVEFSKTEDK